MLNARKNNNANRGKLAQARLVGQVQTPALSTCKKCGLRELIDSLRIICFHFLILLIHY